jgi:hypothetical protein
MNRIVYIGLAVALVIVLWILSRKRIDFFIQEDDFFRSEINGVLLKVEDQTHGEFKLSIRESRDGKVTDYSLSMGKFILDNNIRANDSISKDARSHIVGFYRKENKKYKKISELYY